MQNKNADRPPEEVMWAGPSGERWLTNANRFEAMLQPIGEALLHTASLLPGEHVLDFGCGAGAMSLQIATRIAPGGSVTGLDISPALIGEATRRAQATPLQASVKFLVADAARTNLTPQQADCLI